MAVMILASALKTFKNIDRRAREVELLQLLKTFRWILQCIRLGHCILYNKCMEYMCHDINNNKIGCPRILESRNSIIASPRLPTTTKPKIPHKYGVDCSSKWEIHVMIKDLFSYKLLCAVHIPWTSSNFHILLINLNLGMEISKSSIVKALSFSIILLNSFLFCVTLNT